MSVINAGAIFHITVACIFSKPIKPQARSRARDGDYPKSCVQLDKSCQVPFQHILHIDSIPLSRQAEQGTAHRGGSAEEPTAGRLAGDAAAAGPGLAGRGPVHRGRPAPGPPAALVPPAAGHRRRTGGAPDSGPLLPAPAAALGAGQDVAGAVALPLLHCPQEVSVRLFVHVLARCCHK